MMKRVSLIPLLVLIFCGGISLSSGVYYFDINELIYLVPLLFVAVSYYALRYVFRDFERKEEIAMGVEMAFLLLVWAMLREIIGKGFIHLIETIAGRLQRAWGIEPGDWSGGQEEMVGLAVCCLVSFVAIISLWLYEKGKKAVLVALPSFVLFILSIAVDGVPYEMCFVTYGVALICFLGMGLRGNFKRLLMLAIGASVVVWISFQAIYWPRVETVIRNEISSYFETKMGSGNGLGGSDEPLEPEKTPEKSSEPKPTQEPQDINFGQFNQQGDIFYSGTVQLTVQTDKKFLAPQLYLRNFIGEVYKENKWYGKTTTKAEDDHFGKCVDVTVTKVKAKQNYYPYAIDEDKYRQILEQTKRLTPSNVKKYKNELRVGDKLKEKIQKRIIKERTFTSPASAVGFVRRYLADNYDYTLHPGAVKKHELETFMFDRKKGYCTHFASAGIMMFRTIGIPARLVQGYMLDGVQIKPVETVNVFDSDAHAWVEIYVGGAWLPVDVTPYTNGINYEEEKLDDEEEPEEGEEIEWIDEEWAAKELKVDDAETDTWADEDAGEEWEDDWEEEEWNEEDWDDGSEETEEEAEVSEKPNVVDSHKDFDEQDGKENQLESQPTSQTQENQQFLVIIISFVSFIVFVVAVVSVVVMMRRKKIRDCQKKIEKQQRRETILMLHEGLHKLWKRAELTWSYLDSEEMVKELVKLSCQYVPERSYEEASQYARCYVNAVYQSRFGNQDISPKLYEDSVLWLQRLVRGMELNMESKEWKKVQKMDMVKIALSIKIYEMEAKK